MKKLSQRLVKAAVQGSGQSPGKAARKALQQDIVRKVGHYTFLFGPEVCVSLFA